MNRLLYVFIHILLIFTQVTDISAKNYSIATESNMANAELITMPAEVYWGGEYISGPHALQIQHFQTSKWYVSVMNSNGSSNFYGTFSMEIFGESDKDKCTFSGTGINDATGQKIWFMMTFSKDGMLTLLFAENEEDVKAPYNILKTTGPDNFLVAEDFTAKTGYRASYSQLIKWLSRPLE